MSKVKSWKLDILSKLFADIQGMSKVVAINLLSNVGIGQLVLISKVVADAKATKNLLSVIQAVNAQTDDFSELEKSIKGKGFTQAESLINFTVQLKADNRLMLESLLADDEGKKLVQQGATALLDNYLYVR